jgi:outer membrane scaffolding protein for murein synthesis (MipA/OmpV family)
LSLRPRSWLSAGLAALLSLSAFGVPGAFADPDETAPAAPRWEWGLGIAGAWLRDYPGSRHESAYGLPYPWFVVRSERVEVGREGGRGILFRDPRNQLEFTLSGNPPSDTQDNPERAGMDELDAVLEPGLRARRRYLLGDEGQWQFDLRLPVRLAFAVDGQLRSERIGVHAEPGLALRRSLGPHWSVTGVAALGFAEAGYHGYYYDVTPAEATAWRQAYDADGGYSGWQVGARIGWQDGDRSGGLFLRVENVADAAFADSPLVSTPWGYTVGFNLSWRLGKSAARVGLVAP